MVVGQGVGGGEQHDRVPVVAAGVHFSRYPAGVGQAGLLQDGQRVHVRPDADHPGTGAFLQGADDGGFSQATGHLVAPLEQAFGDQLAGLDFLIAQFGVGMDPVAQFAHFVLDLLQQRDGLGHGQRFP
ncbi:hypothetical protein D3C71_1725690 [compost metagenome]